MKSTRRGNGGLRAAHCQSAIVSPTRGAHTWAWGLILALSLAVGVACVSKGPGGPTVARSAVEETVTVTRHATASVLVEPKPQGPVTEIKTVVISPGSIVLDVGETVELSAEAFGSLGEPLEDVQFVWTLVDPRAGGVSRGGTFVAGGKPGAYNGAVSVMGIHNTPLGASFASASTRVTVVGQPATSRLVGVSIFPNDPAVLARQIYRLRAVGFDENGLVIPGVSFAWRVNDPELGHVNDIGYLTIEGEPREYGDAVTVTGIWEGVRVSVTTSIDVMKTLEADDFFNVEVLPRRFHLDGNDRLQLRAVALNGLGELVTGTQLRWSMVDPQAGTIDAGGNFIAGDTPGIYTEAVRVEAVVPGERGVVRAFDFASVVIRQLHSSQRLESVRVNPATVIVGPGGRTILSVQAVDEFGNAAKDIVVSWEARPIAQVLAGRDDLADADAMPLGESTNRVGEIDDNGSFLATAPPGRYKDALQVTVEQQLEGELIKRTASANVIVTGTLADLELRPALATITPGRAVHFSVSGRDENGIELPGLVVLWSVSDEQIGSIDPFGNFIAGEVPGLYEGAIQVEVKQTFTVSRDPGSSSEAP